MSHRIAPSCGGRRSPTPRDDPLAREHRVQDRHQEDADQQPAEYHLAADQTEPLIVPTNFERALGMGMGDWTFIVAENVDDVFLLFEDLLRYAIAMPTRLREWMA